MIESDIQKLEVGSIVALFELDLTPLGGIVLRYHGHTDGNIVWQGNTYMPWALKADGFARKGTGQQARPTLSISNIGPGEDGTPITGIISSLCIAFDDMVGAKLIRRRTLVKYLDAVNFPDGNPSADPSEHFPDEVWIVEQKTAETPELVDFSLSSPIDFNGLQLPNIQVMASICQWKIKGLYKQFPCSYPGPAMFDKDDNPVSDPTLDVCGGRPNSCKIRFASAQGTTPEWAVINIAAFPSAGRMSR